MSRFVKLEKHCIIKSIVYELLLFILILAILPQHIVTIANQRGPIIFHVRQLHSLNLLVEIRNAKVFLFLHHVA